MLSSIFTTILFASAALCAPTPRRSTPSNHGVLAPLYRRSADSSSTRYIVCIHENTVDPSNRLTWLNQILGTSSGNAQKVSSRSVTTDGGIVHNWDPSVFNGLSGSFNAQELNTIRAQSEVAWVEEDYILRKTASPTLQQNDATWGLARISSADRLTLPNNFDFRDRVFDYSFPATAGAGVDVYIVDTGIRTTHQDFGGRAEFLGSFGDGVAGTDKDGHGTHVAGTATGSSFGVAKNASVFAVKVLGDDGAGATSDIISGLNLVALRVRNVSQATGGGDVPSTVTFNLPTSTIVNLPTNIITALPTTTVVAIPSNINTQTTSSTAAATATPVLVNVGGAIVKRAIPIPIANANNFTLLNPERFNQTNGLPILGTNTIRPSVVNMSLGGKSHSQALDNAVQKLIDQGIVVAVAAGNDGVDVGTSSPADVTDALTVGAMDPNDGVAFFSNFGSKVDVFAPGVGILSCGVQSDSDTAVLQGTSQATPHIAGLAAVFLGENPTLTPAQVKAKIQSLAIHGALGKGFPNGTQTQNLVAFNGL